MFLLLWRNKVSLLVVLWALLVTAHGNSFGFFALWFNKNDCFFNAGCCNFLALLMFLLVLLVMNQWSTTFWWWEEIWWQRWLPWRSTRRRWFWWQGRSSCWLSAFIQSNFALNNFETFPFHMNRWHIYNPWLLFGLFLCYHLIQLYYLQVQLVCIRFTVFAIFLSSPSFGRLWNHLFAFCYFNVL